MVRDKRCEGNGGVSLGIRITMLRSWPAQHVVGADWSD